MRKPRSKGGRLTEPVFRQTCIMVTYLGKASMSMTSTRAIQTILLLRVPGTKTEKKSW